MQLKNAGHIIRFGIIGCGAIAQRYVDVFRNINIAQVAAVADTDSIKADSLAAKFNCKSYQDYLNILDDKNIDIVIIATPSGSHLPIAIEAIGAGKNVVVEKPMAMNLEEADSMIKAAKYSKLMLTTILNNRFLPACSFLKRSIDEDILGRILSSSVNVLWYRPQSYYNESKWRGTTSMDGGVLLNQAIHHVDLMLWYLGDVEKVEAYFDALGHEIEAIDTAVAIVKFKSNAIGTINATTCAYPRNLEETITIIGEKGSVILGGSTLNDFRVWRVDGIPEEDVYNSIRKVETPKWYGHYKQIEDVCLAIIDGREPTVKSTDGRIALELFQRISNMDSVHSS